MNTRVKDILKASLKEALTLPIDKLDQVDPTKLDKLADKTDVVIGDELSEDQEIPNILPAEQVQPGMVAYAGGVKYGKVIEIVIAGEYSQLLDYDSEGFLPQHGDNSQEDDDSDNFYSSIDPEMDYLVAIQYANGETAVGPYRSDEFYCLAPATPERAPQSPSQQPNSSTGPALREDSQFPTATPEQQQGIFDLQSWAAELGLDIGVGEETVGDIIKFGFQGAESWVTILVDPGGRIKVSGHAINTFQDFSDILSFFQD